MIPYANPPGKAVTIYGGANDGDAFVAALDNGMVRIGYRSRLCRDSRSPAFIKACAQARDASQDELEIIALMAFPETTHSTSVLIDGRSGVGFKKLNHPTT